MELCLTYILYTHIVFCLADILCIPQVCVGCMFYIMCVDCSHVSTDVLPSYEALKRSDFPNLLPNCKNKTVKNDGCETSFTMFHMFMNITCINM